MRALVEVSIERSMFDYLDCDGNPPFLMKTMAILIFKQKAINVAKIIRCSPILVVSFLGGCVTNDFAKFYTENAAITKDLASNRLLPYSGATQVYSTNDIPKDSRELSRRGYWLIGQSAFEGPGRASEAQMKEHAKAVGADIVLYRSRYQGSEQSSFPLIQYNPGQTSTTYSSGTANASAYGNGGFASGSATYSGASTTTSMGTFSTSMVPVTLHRYEEHALYWRKSNPPILGVAPANIPEEMRKELKRNTGALVRDVSYDSPAFKANILEGDILIAVDETSIDSAQDFLNKIVSFAGKECKVTVLRDGKEVFIPVKMNSRAPKVP